MKLKSLLIALGILSSCQSQTTERINYWNKTDLKNQLRSELNKKEFDTLHGFDFGWFILEPIDLGNNDKQIKKLSERLSPIQKSLYFFWFLDAQVTNGGFIQFYWNGYDKYLPAIIEGLQVTKDTELLELLNKTEKYYQENRELFKKLQRKDDFQGIKDQLKKFRVFNDTYYEINEKSMELIEKYTRKNSMEVGILK